jgi:hypothetical protein
MKLIPPELRKVCSYFQWLESGMWPSSGGVLEQSATFVDAATIFLPEVARLTEEDMERTRSAGESTSGR